MVNNMDYKKGDILIDFGAAYKIKDVKSQKNLEGKTELYIFYTPVFETNQNRGILCSISLSNLDKTNKRKPLSKSKIYQLLRSLSQKQTAINPVSPKQEEVVFKTNDIEQIVPIIKRLEAEKNHQEKDFSNSKQAIYQQAIDCLTQEVAVVLGITLDKAEQKILSIMRNSRKK